VARELQRCMVGPTPKGKIMKKNGLLSIGIAIFALAGLAPSAANAWSITATGTIIDDASNADTRHGDGMGIFDLTDPSSLVGLTYSETITTNPLLNGGFACAAAPCLTTVGGVGQSSPVAAPYTISVTVNGVTFTQTETTPAYSASGLTDALSTNFTDAAYPWLTDSVGQESESNCGVLDRNCVSGGISVSSTTTPFVPSLDFNQTITAGPFPGSQADFDYQTPDGFTRTQFEGTIDTLTVNGGPVGVPEPGAFLLMGLGIAATIGVMRLKGHSGALIKNSGEL
jgi:hypothetical protein